MNRVLRNTLCRVLVALMAWTPFQAAQAGMIATEQVASSASQMDRAALEGLLGRADVSRQLQSLGVDPAQAKDRILAMSDQELSALARHLDSLPAGAGNHAGPIILIILIGLALWWYFGTRK